MGYVLQADDAGLQALVRLRSLMSGDEQSPWSAPLLAVLLHDPEVHLEVDEWMRWRFAQFDTSSGQHLHFFAFRTPGRDNGSTSFLARARNDPWLRGAPLSTAASEPLRQAWGEGVSDMFGLDPSDLPGFAVFAPRRQTWRGPTPVLFLPVDLTDSPTVSDAYRGPRCLDAKFQMLTSMAQLFASRVFSLEQFHRAILDAWQDGWVMSIDTDHGETDSIPPEVSGSPGGGQNSSPETLLAWAGRLSPAFGRLRSRHPPTACIHPVLQSWMNTADADTRRVFETASTIHQLFRDSPHSSRVDWSPVVGALVKGFERTVDLSVLHAARAAHGIELPEWYGLHKPGASAQEVNVDLNDKRGTTHRGDTRLPWKPPTLGAAQLAYGTCVAAGHLAPAHENDAIDREFRQLWTRLAALRNPGAHDRLGTRSDVDEALRIISRMSECGIPDRLAELRQRLASPDRTKDAPPPIVVRWNATVHLPVGVEPPSHLDSLIEWTWSRAASSEPCTLRLEVVVDEAAVPLGAVPLPLRPWAHERACRDVLMQTALACLRLRYSEEMVAFAAEMRAARQRRDSFLNEAASRAAARSDDFRKRLLRAHDDLRASLELPGGARTALMSHHSLFTTIDAVVPADASFRVVNGIRLPADIDDCGITTQRAAIQRWLAGLRGDPVVELTRDIVASVEFGERPPRAALVCVLNALGWPDAALDAPAGVPKLHRRLVGSIRHWCHSLEAFGERQGGLETAMLALRRLREVDEHLKNQPQALMDALLGPASPATPPPGIDAARPPVEGLLQRLRGSLAGILVETYEDA